MSDLCRESCPIILEHCRQLGEKIAAERSELIVEDLMSKSANYIIGLIDNCPGPIDEAKIIELGIPRIRKNIGLPSEEIVIVSKCRSPKLHS